MQHECIPQAILGMDVICQAKSGMGKTAVFVLSSLQQIDPVAGQVAALVLCHTRELAYQVGTCRIYVSISFLDESVSDFDYLLHLSFCRYVMNLRGSANISVKLKLLSSMEVFTSGSIKIC